ncbi:hypothetical protein Mag101_06655 [Microbulbifer agarilyticus]|uniref:Uncharacterized protein n=1 Tax=Microbulbifer agarilyticus TaxID=260552 RepID=A0A1Q2M3W9_9GAMM|nr:hypothetical protein Mag101_06655 [Microbulbifer agarilyticus]
MVLERMESFVTFGLLMCMRYGSITAIHVVRESTGTRILNGGCINALLIRRRSLNVKALWLTMLTQKVVKYSVRWERIGTLWCVLVLNCRSRKAVRTLLVTRLISSVVISIKRRKFLRLLVNFLWRFSGFITVLVIKRKVEQGIVLMRIQRLKL